MSLSVALSILRKKGCLLDSSGYGITVVIPDGVKLVGKVQSALDTITENGYSYTGGVTVSTM